MVLTCSSASASSPPPNPRDTCSLLLARAPTPPSPPPPSQAREFIAGYARAPASTVGSVIVTNLADGRSCEGVDVTEVHFEPIPQAAVEALLAEGEVYWCAGGLMVEHPLVAPHVTRMVGGQDAVMGLGRALLLRLLCQAAGSGGGAP